MVQINRCIRIRKKKGTPYTHAATNYAQKTSFINCQQTNRSCTSHKFSTFFFCSCKYIIFARKVTKIILCCHIYVYINKHFYCNTYCYYYVLFNVFWCMLIMCIFIKFITKYKHFSVSLPLVPDIFIMHVLTYKMLHLLLYVIRHIYTYTLDPIHIVLYILSAARMQILRQM